MSSILGGIRARDWWSLLRENQFAVDPVYWHRAGIVSLRSLINAFDRRRESRRYGEAIEAANIKAPLFILGHWRSGTTFLYNLLAQDTEQFAFPNLYQVLNPHTFLTTEEVNSRRFARFVPKTREMDNMALNFQTPLEDEFATCVMTLRSPILVDVFPRRTNFYSRYLTFHDVPTEEVEAWKNGFVWFLKKLTVKYDRPLLLKSPQHTARIRLLLTMFPDARFVHIHRDPYTVFRSSQKLIATTTKRVHLQRPDDLEGINDFILQRYKALFDAFFEDRQLIPEGQFHEIRFDELERAPMQEIDSLYNKLGLSDFAKFKPKLQAYLDSLTGYRKNAFSELEPALREKVAVECRRSFEEWSYPI